MKVIYILFYFILNLLVFNRLSKKIFSSKMELFFFIFIAIIFFLQVTNILNFKNLSKEEFLILIAFSLAIFVFHYAINFLLFCVMPKNESFHIKYLTKIFIFFRNYLIYVLISLFHFFTIIR